MIYIKMQPKLAMHKYLGVAAIIASLSACNGSTNSSITPNPPQVNNTVPLIADSGYNGKAFNRMFVTVTICQPGTNICQTIDHIMPDSGSTGLRITKSSIQLSGLPAITYQGLPITQCMNYGGGYVYGGVVLADVRIGDESATSIPLQIIDDGDQSLVPDSCTSMATYLSFPDSGQRGNLGINPMTNPANDYTLVYSCESSDSCTELSNPVQQMPQTLNVNVISYFKQDNNGVIFSMPAIANAPAESVVGQMIFGIGTNSNNQVMESTVAVLGNPSSNMANFTTNTGIQITPAIIDSGTEFIYWYDALLPACPEPFSYLYCPGKPGSIFEWGSMISNYSGGSSFFVQAGIANWNFGGFPDSPVIPLLGSSTTYLSNFSIYGFPFFFGKNIYLGFQGKGNSVSSTALGSSPAWGFVAN